MAANKQDIVTRPPGIVTTLQGPYSGRIARLLGYVPRPLRNFTIEAGGMASLLGKIVASVVRRPTGFWRAVLEDMHTSLKRAWLPATLAIGGFLIFIAILIITTMKLVGAEGLYGSIVFQVSARTFTLWINAIVVIGVLGASLTADIGAQKVREEIDAMEVMGIDPVRELAVPRVISLTLILTMWSVPSMFVTLFFGQLGGLYAGNLSAAFYYHDIFSNFAIVDFLSLVINSFLAGLMIATVCCYKGFVAAGGAVGLGRAVNQAVVISFVSFWILLLLSQSLVVGLFPDIGAYR